MGWCSKCGAEYREGVQQCPRCGVPLADQRPELPAPPRSQGGFSLFLLRRWDEVKRALGYALEAVRVLRRHPSLLLLPLALALFNEAESAVGSYVTFRHTAVGRQWAEMLRNRPAPQPRGVFVRVRFGSVPSVEFGGTYTLLTALGQRTQKKRVTYIRTPREPMWWMPLLFSLSVGAALNALIQAGYYGIALQAVATGTLRRGRFGLYARQFCVRLWVFGAAVALAFSALVVLPVFLLRDFNYSIRLIWMWFVLPAAGFLALAPFVIVADDASVLAAIARGVLTVGRNIVVAVVLFGGVLAVQGLISWPFDWLRSSGFLDRWPAALGSVSWRSLAVDLLQRGLVACLSAFFVAAAFIWYRDPSARKAQAPALPS